MVDVSWQERFATEQQEKDRLEAMLAEDMKSYLHVNESDVEAKSEQLWLCLFDIGSAPGVSAPRPGKMEPLLLG